MPIKVLNVLLLEGSEVGDVRVQPEQIFLKPHDLLPLVLHLDFIVKLFSLQISLRLLLLV